MGLFDDALTLVLFSEGGYSADPADPGNWTGGERGKGELKGTHYGISAAAYPQIDIASLTRDDAAAIYRRDYWDRCRCDEIARHAPRLARIVFDSAVNHGRGAAIRMLQTTLGVQPDGVVGTETMAAITRRGDAPAARLLAERMMRYVGMPHWSRYGRGWSKRLFDLALDL